MTIPPPRGQQPGSWQQPPPQQGWPQQPQQPQPQQSQGWQPQGAQPSFAPPVSFRPHEGPMQTDRSTRLATTSLVWGLVAFCTAWIPMVGMVAIAPGIIGMQRGIGNTMQRRAGRGRGIAGAILGGLGALNGLWMPWASFIVIPAIFVAISQ